MDLLVELRKRLRWITRDLIQSKGLTEEVFCEAMGCSTADLDEYIHLRLTPDVGYTILLAELYNADMNWIYTGNGTPYKDNDRKPSPDQIGAMADVVVFTPEVKSGYLAKAERIIRSDSLCASTLAMLIEVFYDAMENEKKVSNAEYGLRNEQPNNKRSRITGEAE